MGNHKKLKEAEAEKGVTAQDTDRQKAKLDKLAVMNCKGGDTRNKVKVYEYRPCAPKMSRARTIIFKTK